MLIEEFKELLLKVLNIKPKIVEVEKIVEKIIYKDNLIDSETNRYHYNGFVDGFKYDFYAYPKNDDLSITVIVNNKEVLIYPTKDNTLNA